MGFRIIPTWARNIWEAILSQQSDFTQWTKTTEHRRGSYPFFKTINFIHFWPVWPPVPLCPRNCSATIAGKCIWSRESSSWTLVCVFLFRWAHPFISILQDLSWHSLCWEPSIVFLLHVLSKYVPWGYNSVFICSIFPSELEVLENNCLYYP